MFTRLFLSHARAEKKHESVVLPAGIDLASPSSCRTGSEKTSPTGYNTDSV